MGNYYSVCVYCKLLSNKNLKNPLLRQTAIENIETFLGVGGPH